MEAFAAVLAGSTADTAKAAMLRVQKAVHDCQNSCLQSRHAACSDHSADGLMPKVACIVHAEPRALVVEVATKVADSTLGLLRHCLQQGLGFKGGGCAHVALPVCIQIGSKLHPLHCQQEHIACKLAAA